MKNTATTFKTKIYTAALCSTAILAGSLITATTAHAQNISTVAGDNAVGAGFAGDGAAATAAQLNYPGSSTTDAAGNIYIADKENNRIRKVSTTGIITTIVGDGTSGLSGDGGAASAAQLSLPLSVCFDAAGNLYIADFGNSRIRKVNTSGIITTVAGSTSGYSGDGAAATAAQIASPTDVAVDAAGNIYICDYGNDLIRKVDAAGNISTIAGSTDGFGGDGGPATDAMLSNPNGIALDAAGNVYIADLLNDRIRMVNTSGIISTIAGTGAAGYTGDGGPATAAEMHNPAFITVDAAGNIFYSELTSAVVRKINTAGIITTVAGNGTAGYSGDGGAATAAEMTSPTGVNFDKAGNLYITCQGDNVVRKVTAEAIAVSGTMTVCVGATTTLTGAVSGAVWMSGTSAVATVGAASGVVTGVTAGTASISYVTGLGFGTAIVTVNTCPTSIGAAAGKTEKLAVYPNPASTSVTITLPLVHQAVEVAIIDMLGKVVATNTISENQPRTSLFTLTDVPAGSYIIKVTAGDKTYRDKLMVTK